MTTTTVRTDRWARAAQLATDDQLETEAADWLLRRTPFDAMDQLHERELTDAFVVGFIGEAPERWAPKLQVVCRLLNRLGDVEAAARREQVCPGCDGAHTDGGLCRYCLKG